MTSPRCLDWLRAWLVLLSSMLRGINSTSEVEVRTECVCRKIQLIADRVRYLAISKNTFSSCIFRYSFQ
jgi:hypothetical protein